MSTSFSVLSFCFLTICDHLFVFHQISRMVAVLKEVYGTAAYNKHFVHNWVTAADRCNFVAVPEQGANECGFYTLKMACTFDGVKIVEKLKKKDVNPEL